MSTEGGTRAVIAALGANLGIAAAKFVAFAITGSSSMLSEAIHSVADSGNQILLLIGGRRSKRPANANYQFGYGRVRYIYGFIVAIVLFLVGGVFSLNEGIHKLTVQEELHDLPVAVGVLLFALVLEAFSFRTALKESNKARGARTLPSFIRRVRQPELPVILLEDFGALIGLAFALVGVTLAAVTGDSRWDALGAIAVGSLLMVIAIFLAMEMSSMLVGESALPEQQDAIEAALAASPLVTAVIHLRTLHTGPDQLLVAAKIGIAGADTGAEIARGIDQAEKAIRAAVPTATYIFLEPDLLRDDQVPESG